MPCIVPQALINPHKIFPGFLHLTRKSWKVHEGSECQEKGTDDHRITTKSNFLKLFHATFLCFNMNPLLCYWEIEMCNYLKVKGFENPVLLMAAKLHSETFNLFRDRDRSYRMQSWALNQCDLGFS